MSNFSTQMSYFRTGLQIPEIRMNLYVCSFSFPHQVYYMKTLFYKNKFAMVTGPLVNSGLCCFDTQRRSPTWAR